ncbi:ThyX-like thymidylate synthase [Microbacterium phage Cressida]|uniref:ThyX-like thymidylate synthase n=1 Tax=Microbacterium phage Cressida TaxID=2591216 RepID=A0A514DI15_9CAUD|nr:ThyX-like thymidylate synthase [Microbacterium phage Cressida]QDH93250.1 ThyX-like thymidylate synthase [Microbacterium phage Cressida]
MTEDEPGTLIVAVDVVCPYCHVKIGTAREGWLVGVQHGTGGRHSILTADPAKMRTRPEPLTVEAAR